MTPGLLLRQPTEACGVFGILVPEEDGAHITYCGLCSLRHQGQESGGIAVANEQGLLCHKRAAIGHYLHATSGCSPICNVQLILLESRLDPFVLAPSGNLDNTVTLQGRLRRQRYTFNGHTDGEVIAPWMIEASAATWEGKTEQSLSLVLGSCVLAMLVQGRVCAVRDPLGASPLALGRFNHGDVLACVKCPTYPTILVQCCPTFISP